MMLRLFILLTLFSLATIHARNLPADDEYLRKSSAGSSELNKLFTGSRPTSVRENLCKWLIAIMKSMFMKICEHHKNMAPGADVGRPSRAAPPPPRPPSGPRPVAYIQMPLTRNRL